MRFLTLLWINLTRRTSRTVLTSGGIAVAVATAVTLLGIAEDFRRSAIQALSARSVEILVVEDGIANTMDSELDRAIAEHIATVPGVADISPGLIEMIDFTVDDEVIPVLVNGWLPGTFLFNDMSFVAGGPFTSDERPAVLLGDTLAESIGKGVGDTVRIQREAFEVVGIYENASSFESGGMILPLTQLQRAMVRGNYVTGFSLRVDHSSGETDMIERVCDRLNSLTDENGELLRLKAGTPAQLVNAAVFMKIAQGMAWLTSMIAVGVGMLGMLNTMLMAVVERTKEISVLRAVGWKRSRVVSMILGECMMLSVGGALVGIAAAVTLVRWLSTLPLADRLLTGEIAPTILLTGLGLSVVVALIGGAYPALRAAQLRPAQGISHE